MSRRWTELLASVSDWIPLDLLVLILLIAAAAAGALWYFFPRWVPRRWPRWSLPRWRLRWPRLRWRLKWPSWRWRRRPGTTTQTARSATFTGAVELPDLPAEAFASLADALAAQGRYAEAVRERLRSIVRGLVERGVIDHRPGWTVTELAGAAAAVRPAVEFPLGEAVGIFSDIWYGLRPAVAGHDARMRALTTAVADAATGSHPGAVAVAVPAGAPPRPEQPAVAP